MDRRVFISRVGAYLGCAQSSVYGLSHNSASVSRPSSPRTPPGLEVVTEHVKLFRDSVNVGVIRVGNKVLLIDSGDASIVDEASRFGISSIDRVLYTHYHRDQCSGAFRLAPAHIHVPASEARFFAEATEFWRESDSFLYHRYTFRPEAMVLRESVNIDGLICDGDRFLWEGIPIRAMATPGHTDGSLTYFVEIDGSLIAFTGDLIFGPGQIWELYSLQKRFPGMVDDYWGFGGAVPDLLRSIQSVRAQKPEFIVPSHGEIIRNPEEALTMLDNRLLEFMKNYSGLAAWRVSHRIGNANQKLDIPPPFDVPLFTPLAPVKAPAWIHRIGTTSSSYLLADDKSIFLFDAGFDSVPRELRTLVESGTIERVDSIWISHYHDDHTSCVNAVRAKFGGQVYAQRELVDILEQPAAYSMPCITPDRIQVDRVLGEGEKFHWKGYDLTGFFFPGQTLYHEGLLIEREGCRIFLCGDAFGNWAIGDVCSYNRNFIGTDGNAAGVERCLKLLQRLNPDLLYAAHWGPIAYSPDYVAKTLEQLSVREKQLKALLPWDDPNFGLDPLWIRAYPYRQNIFPGQKVTLELRVFNHSDTPLTVHAELRTPNNWQPERALPVTISAHTEGVMRLQALAPRVPASRREILGLVVHIPDRNLGEAAEAIVDYLSSSALP